jgi:RNA polymerase sigma-70 factor (ECF subfamily)
MPHGELVSRVSQGDVDAFAQLFAEFAPRVRAWLARGVDTARADELTQEVMVRVWKSAGRYDARRGAVSTWIFTIARNARTDALRGFKIEVDETDPCFVADPADLPDQVAADAQRDRGVADALAELPPDQAEVLRCAYYAGLSLREIATQQEVPLGTVKSRVRLALERLRGRLAGWEEG